MISPSEVHSVAKKMEQENFRFRTFLKNHADPDELDRQFLELHQELFHGYDCCQCANCCRAFNPVLEDQEIESISAFLEMDKDMFIQEYLTAGSEGYELKAPCRFLESDGKCRIQKCKPAQCKGFPYTDKPERLFSLYSVLSFAEECPIVFEILQRLKRMYHFRSRR